jgi:hydrocephalus-inducing protein
VSFVVDKHALEAFGFGMMPEAAIKLAGAPECQSAEVTFSVLASKAWLQPGPQELTLPLQVKGGPAVLLTLRALLVVPDVVPSSSVLDFGTVTTGHCKVCVSVCMCWDWGGGACLAIAEAERLKPHQCPLTWPAHAPPHNQQVFTVRLHNPREVPAEWCVKRPAVDSPKLRDWAFFATEPAEGSLEPGATAKLKVVFTPVLGREQPYTLPLPIKVANNPKPRVLACSGRGHTPRVEFSPLAVDCGAILPKLPGQRPVEASLQLRNLGNRPVEVVCLDLDVAFWSDEEALRSLTM